eukprot:990202-Prymnesium_polylepis.1
MAQTAAEAHGLSAEAIGVAFAAKLAVHNAAQDRSRPVACAQHVALSSRVRRRTAVEQAAREQAEAEAAAGRAAIGDVADGEEEEERGL